MHKAEGMEILFANEINPGILHCRSGSRIIAAIEKWQLGNRAAGAFNCKDLLATIGRTLEYPHTTALNHKQAGAGFAFRKKQLALAVLPRNGAFGKELEFSCGETVKDLDASKNFQSLRYGSHGWTF